MSLSNTVKYDDHIQLPAGVAAAFDRNMRVLANSPSFIDRVPALADMANTVLHWRWANVIDGEQYGFLVRKLRRQVELLGLGEITDRDCNSAVECNLREAECVDLYESVGIPTT